MYHSLLTDSTFYNSLDDFDLQIAHQARQDGCLFCNGNLNQSNYQRKPRGVPKGTRLRNSAIRLRIYGNPTKTEALLSIFDRYNNFLFCCATCPPFINWLHGYSVIRTIRSNFLTTV